MANIYQDPSMKQVLSRIVRSNMDLSGLTYKQLCRLLQDKFGIEHNPDTLRNKVSSGALGTQMFLFILLTMEVEQLNLADVGTMYWSLRQQMPGAN